MTPRAKILCVDDEPGVLRGLQLHLSRLYEVRIATSGPAALSELQENPDVAVILSDMRMPGMNGAEFLAKSLAVAPVAQRILLTGDTDLAAAIAAVNEGQIFRFLTKPCVAPVLLRAIAEAVERGRALELERTGLRRRVEHQQLQIDPLTGLGSRQCLMAALEAAAYEPSESSFERTAYLIDIDASDEPMRDRDLPWGDEVVMVIADRLRMRVPDAAQLTRWGPDQLVVLISSAGIGDEALVARAVELHGALTAPVSSDGYSAKIGVTIGVARLVDRLLWRRLIQQAASAARQARSSTGVCLYRPDTSGSSSAQRELLKALRETLASGGLELHYQPVVNAATGRAHSLEALVRWRHSKLGDIAPSTFIPMLELSGDIAALGRWVLWTACHEALPFVRGGQLGLSVNVSPQQMLEAGFLDHLEECLSHSGLPPEALQLELTETALASDLDRLCEVMVRVRDLKVRLAVDDFGTGYSSLSYLSRLPIDTLKVDQIFVQDFHRGGKTIIKAALSVAMDFGQEVIVEGIETDDMLREVCDLGVSLIQGFRFAKPMPGSDVAQWLRSFQAG